MKKWSAALILFNIIDTSATAYVLAHGLAVEYNPIVGYLFSVHPTAFVAAKMVLMWAAVTVSFRSTDNRVRWSLILTTVFYGFLSLYQIAVLFSWSVK